MKTTFVQNNGFKAFVSAARNKVMKEAAKRKQCPKCERDREVKFFGVRTFKDATGKPNRFALQSYCVDCRGGKLVKKVTKPTPAPKAAAPKTETPVQAQAPAESEMQVAALPAPVTQAPATKMTGKGKRKLFVVDLDAPETAKGNDSNKPA